MIKAVEKIKPDITYFINYHYHGYTYYPVNGSIKSDPGFKYWNQTFERMSKASKALIVSLKALSPYFLPVTEFMKRRKNGPVVLDIKNEDFNKMDPILQRFSALKFKNLYLLDVLKPYCGENVCHTIDPDTGLPLFRDRSHITIVGLKRLFPYVFELTTKALSEQIK
uniref:SGNH domain-containing protein n=1 Tax=Panagrolaimus sp. JU765 TaxID=591449 RepID=A0AC34R4T3_9BILA